MSADRDDPILSVRSLSSSFRTEGGTVRILDDVSLDLPRGRTTAVVGESGSGKTLLSRTIIGAVAAAQRIDGGTVVFRSRAGGELPVIGVGADPRRVARSYGRSIAVMPQNPLTALNPVMTVGAQLTEGPQRLLGMSRRAAREHAADLLGRVGLAAPREVMRQYPHELSGGMRQRAVLAIALACGPELLVCDEPTTALDSQTQLRVLDLLRELAVERGHTVLFITHNLGVVTNLADRVAVMYAGQIIEEGTRDDVLLSPAHPYTWGLLRSYPPLGRIERELYAIPGEPHVFTADSPPGDPFARRNEYALAIDLLERPPLTRLSATHSVRSWLADPRAPRIDPSHRAAEVQHD